MAIQPKETALICIVVSLPILKITLNGTVLNRSPFLDPNHLSAYNEARFLALQVCVSMSELNPYESPRIPSEEELEAIVLPSWPQPGIYRDQAFLVLHVSARLPSKCLKTEQETTNLYPVPRAHLCDDDGTGVTPVAPNTSRLSGLSVPVSRHWLSLRHRRLVASGVMLIVGMASYLAAPFTFAWLGCAALLLVIPFLTLPWCAVGLLDQQWTRVADLHRIRNGFYWIYGASDEYLSQWPEWPREQSIYWDSPRG